MFYKSYLLLKLSLFEALKRKKSFIFGIFSITICISSIIVLISIVSQITLVLFKFSEVYQEESDILFTPAIGSSFNYSLISNITKDQFSTPRIEQFIKFWSRCNTSSSIDWPYLKDYGCMFKYEFCVPENCKLQFTTSLIAIDTKLDKRIGFGRAWGLEEIPYGSVYMTETLLNMTGLHLNDTIWIDFKILDFPEFLQDISVPVERTLFNSFVFLPFRIDRVVKHEDYVGKTKAPNPIFIELKHLFPMILKHIHPLYRKNQTVDPYGYVKKVHFNLEKRIEQFQTSNFQEIKLRVIELTSRISYLLGFNQINTYLPLIENLEDYKDIETYSTLTTSLTCILINLTCIIVVSSIFLMNIESSKINHSIHRLLGMKKSNLYLILLLEMIWYFFPSILISYFIGTLLYIVLSQILTLYFKVPFALFINFNSFLFSLLSCAVIFIISALPSLINLYNTNNIVLSEFERISALEIQHKIERSIDDSPNYKMIVFGIFLSAFGVASCYLYPLGLYYKKDNIIIVIFIISIFFIIFGLILLSFNLENLIQFTLTRFLFYFSTESIRELITKNLKSHKFRNRRSVLLFSLSLSTIIFLSVTFHLQTESFKYYSQKPFGARFTIISNETKEETKNFQFELEKLIKNLHFVNGYTFMSLPLNIKDKSIEISNMGKLKSFKTNILAVAPNFFDVLTKDYFKVSESIKDDDISNGIYSKEGDNRLIISEYIRKDLNININDNFLITIDHDKSSFKPFAFLKSSSGNLNMNDLNTVDTLVTFPQYLKLSNGTVKSIQDIQIQKFFISVHYFTTQDINLFYKNLTTIIGMRKIVFIDNESTLSTLYSISEIFDSLSYIIITFILLICGFSFVSSIYLNIQDQQREIGIFRSLGIKRFSIIKLFVFESFIIILTSFIIGISVGTIVSYLVSVQRSLFTQIDLPFLFPWRIILVAFPVMLIGSLLSIFPSYSITQKEIISNLQYK